MEIPYGEIPCDTGLDSSVAWSTCNLAGRSDVGHQDSVGYLRRR